MGGTGRGREKQGEAARQTEHTDHERDRGLHARVCGCVVEGAAWHV